MAVPILNYFPASITAGDTARVTLTFGSYPSNGGWTATLKLNKQGSPAVSIAGTASSQGFLFVITDTITAGLAAGDWTWGVRVTDGTDSKTAGGGRFTMLANYAGIIESSDAQKALALAWATYRTILANPNSSGSWNGQSWSQSNSTELLNHIQRLQAQVNAENAIEAGLRGDAPTRSIRPWFC